MLSYHTFIHTRTRCINFLLLFFFSLKYKINTPILTCKIFDLIDFNHLNIKKIDFRIFQITCMLFYFNIFYQYIK